jgi:hypothetical protein
MAQPIRLDKSPNEIRQRLENSGLFDSQFYLSTYPDIAKAKCDPLNHFLLHGASEGRCPHPLFDTCYYKSLVGNINEDNPLLHFLDNGYKQGFNPHPLFDINYYRSQTKDLIGEQNPLIHFLEEGYKFGLDPHPLFNTDYYREQTGASTIGENALLHFLKQGVGLNLNPHPIFDVGFYLEQNPQLRKTNVNPLTHFVQYGAKENNNPHPLFDSSYYWQSVTHEEHFGDNALLHFLKYGVKRKYSPHPLFDIEYYVKQVQDLSENENPLIHFLQRGYLKNLNTHPLFDTVHYRAQIDIGNKNALLHFLKYGNQFRLSPHQYFDTNFYLNKYTDLRKGKCNALVHFVQHGAREYRWPNAHFDPIYYSKLVPHAYANNFLLHYITIGQSKNIATQSDESNWHIPETLALAIRSFIFILSCLIYCLKRNSIKTLANSGHDFSNHKFFILAIQRFWQGCGANVKYTIPSYLSQPIRLEQPGSYKWQILKYPAAYAYLYLANVFKTQGLFADSQHILEELANHTKIPDLALCSLGDLYLIQAIWADEFRSYESEGIVQNIFPQSKDKIRTWHTRSFEEALNVIEKSLDINSLNTDAQWLLCYALLCARQYNKALLTLKQYPGKKSEYPERNLFLQRAHYALDHHLDSPLFETDNTSRTIDLKIVKTANIPEPDLGERTLLLAPAELSIKSNTVHKLQSITHRSVLKFPESYVCEFPNAEIFPEYGVISVANTFFIRESCHMKSCHASLFNSCIQQITDKRVLMATGQTKPFQEENCIYIGHNNNFYHWLIDELPRLALIETNGQYRNAPVLTANKIAQWQTQLLSMLGIDEERLRSIDFGRPNTFKNLIVPSRLSRDMVAHPTAISFMRKRLLPNADNSSIKPGNRIYVSRTQNTSTGRTMLNQQNIISKFKKANFRIIDPTLLSLEEQIELFSDADVIAGPVGAALTNILFAPKQARVLSLGPDQFIGETYTSIANAIGQESWSVRGTSYARPYANLIWTNFDYEISETDLEYCFNHIL